jgi:hypothetical protein
MKIIITENKLRDLQLQYLNNSIGSDSDFEEFIIVYYPSSDDEDEFMDDVMMEFDHTDGRLYIDKSFLDNFGKVYFPNEDDAGPFIKNWFEHQYGVDIEYIQS